MADVAAVLKTVLTGEKEPYVEQPIAVRSCIVNPNVLPQEVEGNILPLLYTARQTAAALVVSQRTLWTLTQKRGLPCVRVGRLVRYAPDDLKAWIESQKGNRH